jgi:hypothetical protein
MVLEIAVISLALLSMVTVVYVSISDFFRNRAREKKWEKDSLEWEKARLERECKKNSGLWVTCAYCGGAVNLEIEK